VGGSFAVPGGLAWASAGSASSAVDTVTAELLHSIMLNVDAALISGDIDLMDDVFNSGFLEE